MGPTALLPPKEVMLKIFIALKNPSASAGFEIVTLGSNIKYITTKPPRATTTSTSQKQKI
jgi:hypothetical protein